MHASRTAVPEDMSFFTGLKNFDPRGHFTNSLFHNHTFISSSINPRVATNFTGSDGHIIRFRLPKGYNRGTYVSAMSYTPHELEYIIHPDQQWQHTDTKIVNIKPPGVGYKGLEGDHNYKAENVHVHTLEPKE